MEAQLKIFWDTLFSDYRKRYDEIIYNALKEKGYDPEDKEFLKKHLSCKIFQPETDKEHYYIDNTHVITIQSPWKRI